MWSEGADGGKPIEDYKVERFDGVEWVQLVDNLSEKQYVATGLQSGYTHQFRVYARNEVGYSLPSDTLEILTAIVPIAPE